MITKNAIIYISLVLIFSLYSNCGITNTMDIQQNFSNSDDLFTFNESKLNVLKKINTAFRGLCSYYKEFSHLDPNVDFINLTSEFENNIVKKSKIFQKHELVDPVIKNTKSLLYCAEVPKYASATKGNIYNAAKIPLYGGCCIAAQGPHENTFEDFFALIGENNANISISQVHKDEFIGGPAPNKRLRDLLPKNNPTFIIPSVKNEITGDYLRDEYKIELIDYYVDNDASLEYEVFAINGKLHLRIYNTDWVDDCSSNIIKILAIAIFIEKHNNLEIFSESNSLIVSNCNAGIGRAGTFLSILNIVRCYLNNTEIMDVDEFILQARNNRKFFVFSAPQYEMIKYIAANHEDYLPAIVDYLK